MLLQNNKFVRICLSLCIWHIISKTDYLPEVAQFQVMYNAFHVFILPVFLLVSH